MSCLLDTVENRSVAYVCHRPSPSLSTVYHYCKHAHLSPLMPRGMEINTGRRANYFVNTPTMLIQVTGTRDNDHVTVNGSIKLTAFNKMMGGVLELGPAVRQEHVCQNCEN